jgi:tetratricopeptide (TPR) repeat protein
MIENILKIKPDEAETLTRKGELLIAAGDAKTALEYFKRATNLDKDLPRSWLGAARASFQLRDYDSCARYARLSLDDEKKHPYQAHYLIGAALAKMGNVESARKELELYIELNPNIDKSQKPIIAFTKDNDVSLVVQRRTPVDVSKRIEYTPEELAEARELIKALIEEESVRLRLTPEEIVGLIEYIAEIYGKKPQEMLADFLANRETTYEKVRDALVTANELPREGIKKQLAQDGQPAAMEALLSMAEPQEALARLKELVEARPEVARYHYLLGRYYISNPKEFGKEALRHLKLAAALEEKNALYHYTVAYASLKMGQEATMLDELAVKGLDLLSLGANRVAVSRERQKILQKLGFSKRILKVTAWTVDDQFEVRIIKAILEAVIKMAEGFSRQKLYSAGLPLAELAYYTTLQIEESTSSALMTVTVRSVRESALGTIVELHTAAAADQDEPQRNTYAKNLTGWSKRLEIVEHENLVYLRAYVEFLRQCENAFQVLPFIKPSGADDFVDRLMQSEVSVLKEELDRFRTEKKK